MRCARVSVENFFNFSNKKDYILYKIELKEKLRIQIICMKKIIIQQLVRNSLWDIHNTDYEKVGTSGKEAAETINETYMEYRNYYEGRICAGKVITDLCWHPTLSGIAITAYSDNADSDITTEPQPIDQVLFSQHPQIL